MESLLVGDTSPEAIEATFPAKRNRIAEFCRGLGDYLNVVMFLLTVISIFIAVEAYRDAHDSGVQQAQLLTDARNALRSEVQIAQRQEQQAQSGLQNQRVANQKQSQLLTAAATSLKNVVGTAQDQQRILQQSLATSRKQYAIVRSEYDAQVKAQQARPRLQFTLDGYDFNAVQRGRVPLVLKNGSSGEIRVLIRNVGKAILRTPRLLFEATPSSVALQGVGLAVFPERPNTAQANNFVDMYPFSPDQMGGYGQDLNVISNGASRITIRVTVIGLIPSGSGLYSGQFRFLVRRRTAH